MNKHELNVYRNRLLVSELINDVLVDKKTVREALELFPKDINDINIKCAFDALVHREADIKERTTISQYKEVQDEYLYELSSFLKQNKNLPQNIISRYVYYHKDNLIYKDEPFLKSVWKSLKRMVNF